MLTHELLQEFETGLDPQHPEDSSIPCKILGYGEISCVLQIDNDPEVAAKRMPLFDSMDAAEHYATHYRKYCDLLREAGLHIPEDRTEIVQGHAGVVTLYILQKQLNPHRFCHKLIQVADADRLEVMAKQIIAELEKIWVFNTTHAPALTLAIDGQLSNWVYDDLEGLYYIDTSTPLKLEEGRETLDPELLLQSAPSFLRWLIRWQFLDDVMTRYYDRRLVYTDLIANLFKEQRANLVLPWIDLINAETVGLMEPLVLSEIEAYYKEDKLIWRLFLGLRRLDRWIKTKLLGQRYEFVLPGQINR